MYKGCGVTITRDNDNSGLFTVNGTTQVQFCKPTGIININLPAGVYTMLNLSDDVAQVMCELSYPRGNGSFGYISEGSFTLDDDGVCSAYISTRTDVGTQLSDIKVGAMLNSGSVALPFSEYTDVAVVK